MCAIILVGISASGENFDLVAKLTREVSGGETRPGKLASHLVWNRATVGEQRPHAHDKEECGFPLTLDSNRI